MDVYIGSGEPPQERELEETLTGYCILRPMTEPLKLIRAVLMDAVCRVMVDRLRRDRAILEPLWDAPQVNMLERVGRCCDLATVHERGNEEGVALVVWRLAGARMRRVMLCAQYSLDDALRGDMWAKERIVHWRRTQQETEAVVHAWDGLLSWYSGNTNTHQHTT